MGKVRVSCLLLLLLVDFHGNHLTRNGRLDNIPGLVDLEVSERCCTTVALPIPPLALSLSKTQ